MDNYEVLLSGARWLASDTLGKPWADKRIAQELRREFHGGMMSAKADSLLGGARGPLRLKNKRYL